MTNLLTLQGIEGAVVLGRARERVISDELHTMLVTWLERPSSRFCVVQQLERHLICSQY